MTNRKILTVILATATFVSGALAADVKKTKDDAPASDSSAPPVNPQAKLMAVENAKILAQRNIVETVYGLKLKFTEEVNNIIDGAFEGSTETKTGKRSIKGIEYEVIKYDPKRDVAQVTAALKLSRIADIIDKSKFDVEKFPDKTIRRTAFATTNPEVAKKLLALRAAEIDAYKNLYKKIGGFTLESQSKVENFTLKSDKIKASVIGAVMGAELVGFDWEGKGSDAVAIVKLRLNVKELSEMIGEKIIDYDADFVEADGYAAQKDAAAKPQSDSASAPPKISSEVKSGSIEVLP